MLSNLKALNLGKLLFLLLYIFFINGLNSQVSNSSIVFDSQELILIKLKTHKNLLLFGNVLENKPKNNKNIKDYHLKTIQVNEINNVIARVYRSYFGLVEHKFMYKAYEMLPKDKIVVPRNRTSHEYISQKHLTDLSHYLLKDEYWDTYFYDPRNGAKYGKDFRIWGGEKSSKVKELTAYKNFISKNYRSIVKASENLWKDDTCEAYLVFSVRLGTYSLSKGGYHLNDIYSLEKIAHAFAPPSEKYNVKIDSHGAYTFPVNFDNKITPKYASENDFEYKYEANGLRGVYLKSQELTPELKTNIHGLVKVKLTWLTTSTNGEVTMGVSITDPKIEFYQTNALKSKIGEITL